MATITTNAYSNRSLSLDVWETGNVDIAGNRREYGYKAYGSGSYTGYVMSGNFYVSIGGVQVYHSSTRIQLWQGTVVCQGTIWLNHNNDGSKWVDMYCEAGIYNNAVNCRASGGFNATTVPRQANLTGATDFNDESNPTITYNNPAGNSVTELKAGIYDTAGSVSYVGYKDVNKTGSSFTFNLSEEERNNLRSATVNSNSLRVRFYLRTTIGGNQYFSYVEKTMTIVNGNPTFSNFTYKDTNTKVTTLTSNNQVLVKGLSTLQVAISSSNKMVAIKKANAKNYVATVDNINKSIDYSTSDLNIELGTITSSGTKRLNVRAYDSRNNSTLVYKDIVVYDYDKPVINAMVNRLNNFENTTYLNVSGTYSKLTIDDTDKNTVTTLQYRYKEQSGEWSEWQSLNSTIENGTFNCEEVILSLDNTKAFDFEIQAIDNLESTTLPLKLDIGQAIFFISSNKKACYINGQEILTYEIIDEWED